MTIRIEREALLTVINTSQRDTTKTAPTSSFSSNSCYPCIEDEFVIVDSLPTKDTIPNSTKDDETASLCTLSTSSTSYIDSSSDVSTVERSVSFAPQLVTDVWTRERTLPEEVSNLFYSATETQTVCNDYTQIQYWALRGSSPKYSEAICFLRIVSHRTCLYLSLLCLFSFDKSIV